MRKINYPLIISDFDGTLLGSDGAVSDATKRKIDEYIAAGGTFGICTGRMFTSILPRARELGLKGLVASYQGSVITDIKGGKNQHLAYCLKKYLVYFLYVIDLLKKRYKDLFSKYAETSAF